MNEVRSKNHGTWDRTTGSWRIKGRKIQKSPKQLAAILGCEVPPTKEGSRPFWNRFLLALDSADLHAKKKASPLQERIRSLDTLIRQFTYEKRDTTELQAELERCAAIPNWDTDHDDIPALHPDLKKVGDILGSDELTVRLLNSLAPKPIPQAESLEAECSAQVERHRAKGHKGHYATRQSLNYFLEATGKIRVTEITVQHYRKFLAIIAARYPTEKAKRTKYNISKIVKSFLERLEADHDLRFSFLKNPDYKLQLPAGNKEQYTDDQLCTALDKSRGIVRCVLLCGLNFGWYWGDISEATPAHFDGDHCVKGRAKSNYQQTRIVASWKIWRATKEAIIIGLTNAEMERVWQKFQIANKLPPHKALRKTAAQWIQDNISEEASRLYRCEKGQGTHHASYIKAFTPAQIDKLDKALDAFAKFLKL